MTTLSEKYPFSWRPAIRYEARRIVTEIQALSDTNSPNHTHYMVEIDDLIWRNLNTADHDFFIAQFNGIFSISRINGERAVYLMVHANDRVYFSLTQSFRVHPQRIR